MLASHIFHWPIIHLNWCSSPIGKSEPMPVFVGISRTHVHCQRYCGVSLTASSSHVKSHRRRFILRIRVASVWKLVLKAFNISRINDRNMTSQTPWDQFSLDQWGCVHLLPLMTNFTRSFLSRSVRVCISLTIADKLFKIIPVYISEDLNAPFHCWQILLNHSSLDRWRFGVGVRWRWPLNPVSHFLVSMRPES